MYNKPRDHKGGDENSKWDVFLNLSNSETFFQEDIFLLNLVEEHNDIPLGVLEKNGVVNVEILNEVVDISLKNNHENSFKSSSKDRFDSVTSPNHPKKNFKLKATYTFKQPFQIFIFLFMILKYIG